MHDGVSGARHAKGLSPIVEKHDEEAQARACFMHTMVV